MIDDDNIDWSLIREQAKQAHDERVAKTPERIEYAIKRFNEENIKYILKSKSNGHFHVLDKDGNLFQFWASTGKIYFDKKTKDARGFSSYYEDYRGIEKCIKIVKYFTDNKQSACKKMRDFINSHELCNEFYDGVNAKLLSLLDDIEKEI